MAPDPTDRRIIEVEMPLTKISEHSAREKSIRHGHLSTLHIWWARRPLAACRAAIFAALVPQPDDPKEAKKLQSFIAGLADWDNSIDNNSPTSPKGIHHYIKDARAHIKQAFPDRAPRVLDPFSGGGAIPLEALRLGCETYAFDLNPVAHIVQLATLVYPQQYARRPGPYEEQGEGGKGLGIVDDETRFYVLWRWTYDGVAGVVGATGENGNGARKKTGPLAPLPAAEEAGDGDPEGDEGASAGGKADKKKKIPFGDAHLMATALGADINALIHRHQILEGRSDVQLLSAAERDERSADFGERRADGSRPPLIDVLHRCELLWAANMGDELADYLGEFAPDEREALRRVAQALIDVLPRGDLEKQRLEGFLYSGVAQQSSTGPRPGATVQEGLGEEFGVTGKVIRERKGGKRR